jgi:hypothetical protein
MREEIRYARSAGTGREHAAFRPPTIVMTGAPSTGPETKLALDRDELGVLRRALEARARDMQRRLGGEPGDEGFRREASLATRLLRQVEALERLAGHRPWGDPDRDES